ncbi:MAG TPA: hypothetical protein VIC28_07885 [Thermoanaerobaculia bacterium]
MRFRVGTLLLSLALLALPAAADVYHVVLKNGSEVLTERQPEQASFDPNMVLLLTEVGNWVGFAKDEIESIRAENPADGYGVRISDNAIALGWSPNDLPGAEEKPADVNDRFASIAERMLEAAERQQSYSINQFVQPDETQGIPASFGGYTGGTTSGFSGLPLNQAPLDQQDRITPVMPPQQ